MMDTSKKNTVDINFQNKYNRKFKLYGNLVYIENLLKLSIHHNIVQICHSLVCTRNKTKFQKTYVPKNVTKEVLL